MAAVTTTHYPPGRIESLDGLRGLAALVVVVHHLLLLFPGLARVEVRQPGPLSTAGRLVSMTPLHLLWAGDEAVIVFFILSGLALALPVLRPSRFRWRSYFTSRLMRLYLPTAAAVIGALALLLLAIRPIAGDSAPGSVRTLTVPRVLADMTLLRDPSVLDNPLWSLHYEVVFSLLLPLFVLVAVQTKRSLVLPLALALALSATGEATHVALLQFLPVFLIGVVLARDLDAGARLQAGIERLRRPGLPWAIAVAGAAALLPIAWYPSPIGGSTTLSWMIVVVSATVLVAAATHWPAARRALTCPPVRRLGGISFSLYLVHEPIILTLRSVLGPHPILVTMIGLPTAVGAAWVFFHLVERPSHRFARMTARRIEAVLRRPRWIPVVGMEQAVRRRLVAPTSAGTTAQLVPRSSGPSRPPRTARLLPDRGVVPSLSSAIAVTSASTTPSAGSTTADAAERLPANTTNE